MNKKTRLEARMARLLTKKKQLDERCKASTDVNEVRQLTEQLEEVNADIADVQAEIDEIADDEARQQTPPATAEVRNAIPGVTVGSYKTEKRTSENPYESLEYRKAFMKYVQRGTQLPAEVISSINSYRESLPAEERAGVPIATADTAPAIPLTIMREVINTVRKRYGNLYAKVTKTSVPGGVEYPIGALQATFKWVTESTVSPRQKLAQLGSVMFKYNTAEIRIAQTFLAQLLTIEDFEIKITEVIAVAYLKAMDDGIVNGTGDGQMLGILNDPRVAATTNSITMTAAQISNWTAWRKNFFAKIPLGYRYGEFIFPMSTVDAYLETMADSNNNPIFRQATGLEVNDGDAMNPNGRFFGREVALVEPDILPDFDTASAGDVIGIFWNPADYVINENFGFTMRRYFDEETNEWIDKALVVVDGKIVNPNGVWLIKKGS